MSNCSNKRNKMQRIPRDFIYSLGIIYYFLNICELTFSLCNGADSLFHKCGETYIYFLLSNYVKEIWYLLSRSSLDNQNNRISDLMQIK